MRNVAGMILCSKEIQTIDLKPYTQTTPSVTSFKNKIWNQRFVLMSVRSSKRLDLLTVVPQLRQSFNNLGCTITFLHSYIISICCITFKMYFCFQ